MSALLEDLGLLVPFEKLQETPQVPIDAEDVEEATVEALMVVIRSVEPHSIEVPCLDGDAGVGHPLTAEVRDECSCASAACLQASNPATQRRKNTRNMFGRCERQREKTVDEPSQPPPVHMGILTPEAESSQLL